MLHVVVYAYCLIHGCRDACTWMRTLFFIVSVVCLCGVCQLRQKNTAK